MEFTWNAMINRTTGISPFEAAHDLPTRTPVDTLANSAEYSSPATIDQAGITALSTTAKTIHQILRQQQLQEATQRAADANKSGIQHDIKVGDDVSFYIPPTEKEAERTGRKVKHLAQFKGPAKVIAQLSPTTFAIEYNGSKYGRCLSELRRYHAANDPNLTDPSGDNVHKFIIGNFVALCDTDDPSDKKGYHTFHVAKIINIADGLASLQNFATMTRKLTQAKWKPLYQLSDGAFTLTKPRKNADELRVIDVVEVEDQDYVRMFNVQLTPTGKVTAATRRKLAKLKLRHHVLGLTYP